MTEQIGTSNLLRTWANDGAVVVPADAKIDEGWLRGEQPPHEWMNYIHNVLGQKVNHALSRGAADWNGGTEYLAGATVNRNGVTWLALTTNENSEPSDGNTNWAALYSRDNILGTVSQSGGVPTGAIIQRGSNANGEFVKYADGTLICYNNNLATPSQGFTWTFPAAFVEGGEPAVVGIVLTALNRVTTNFGSTPTGVEIYVHVSDTGSASNLPTRQIAIGRWF